MPRRIGVLVALGCLPVNEAECDTNNWKQCRADLIKSIFNATSTPSRKPDYILPQFNYTMNGLPGPGDGTHVGDVHWSNNLTALVWTIRSPFISLNTTIFHSLNTSGRAVANYEPPPYAPGKGPGIPTPSDPWGQADGYAPKAYSDTVILYQNGHETADCVPNYDGVVDYFNELGYDVMELMMPLIGCNQAYQYGNPRSHQWFQQWEDKGDYTIRFFIEPVALAAAYANSLGYKHIVMVGLSGGGWTTTVAAAALEDIELSFPIAGSIPKWPTETYPKWVPDLPEGRNSGAQSPDVFHPAPTPGAGGDYEQEQERPFYASVGGYAQLYVLGALESGRHQVQLLHEYDSCCFRAAGLFDEIKDYNAYVEAHAGGWMQTAVTAGNYHEVNLRDKVVVATVVEQLREDGALNPSNPPRLPFDNLKYKRRNGDAILA